MKANLIVLLIAVVIAVLFSGTFLGMLIEKQILQPSLDKVSLFAEVADSKVISSISAFGQVESISDQSIVLSKEGSMMEIKITGDTKYDDSNSLTGQGSAQVVKPKVGDSAGVFLKVLQTGEFEAVQIITMPPAGMAL